MEQLPREQAGSRRGHLDFEDQQGNGDGEYSIGEGLDARCPWSCAMGGVAAVLQDFFPGHRATG